VINPRNIALNGYLANTLSQSVDGYLGSVIKGISSSIGKTIKKIDKSKLILEDDKEVLLLIKIFSRWL
jgi:hypothetical protein